jgi:CheY-like chemotaxis protein
VDSVGEWLNSPPARPEDPKKILVADDEPEMLRLLETGLSELGYSVVRAQRHRSSGICRKRHTPYHSRHDHAGNGWRHRPAVRSRQTPDVKVLVASGYTSPEKTPVLEALGIEGFVQKPFELAKLACTVRDVLDGIAV